LCCDVWLGERIDVTLGEESRKRNLTSRRSGRRTDIMEIYFSPQRVQGRGTQGWWRAPPKKANTLGLATVDTDPMVAYRLLKTNPNIISRAGA
jgi:hypothetical protein